MTILGNKPVVHIWAAAVLAMAGAAQAQTKPAAAAPPPLRHVALGQPALAATPQGRADLKYLSYCTLEEGTVLAARHRGKRYTFPGMVGLAPRWHAQALSVAEQHSVSACLLALRNHSGAEVDVSLFFPQPPPVAIRSGWLTLERQYKVPEGRYFGNLFVDPPVAYVCSERFDAAKTAWLRQRPRWCALPGDKTDEQGRHLTVCEMRHVGACKAEGSFTQDGVHYETSVQVFLPENGKPAR